MSKTKTCFNLDIAIDDDPVFKGKNMTWKQVKDSVKELGNKFK